MSFYLRTEQEVQHLAEIKQLNSIMGHTLGRGTVYLNKIHGIKIRCSDNPAEMHTLPIIDLIRSKYNPNVHYNGSPNDKFDPNCQLHQQLNARYTFRPETVVYAFGLQQSK